MFRTAVRNVFAHKARLLMTVLAVLLGVSFVSGTLVFTSTISDALQKSSEKGFDNLDVAVRPDKDEDEGKPGEASWLSQDLLRELSKMPEVSSATGTVSGFAAVADKDGDLIGNGWSTASRNYAPGKDGKDTAFPMTDGRGPKSSGEVALDSKTADRGDYHVGDTVRISVDGPVLKKKVVGVFTTDDGNVTAGGSLTLFDTRTAQRLYDKPGQYEKIELTATDGTSQAELKARVEKVLPAETEAVTQQKLADDQADDIEANMDGMRTFFLVFAGIALFVGIFIIANTFTMLVAQRTRELALMRAVGASRRQVTRSVLIEASVVGTVAGVVGLLLGIGIGAGLRAMMSSGDATVPDGPLVVSPGTVVASLAIGIVVTVLAAWLPGRRAAKIPPVAAMNSVHAAPTTRGLLVRNTIGSLLTGAGVVLVLAGTAVGSGGKALMGFGAVLTVIGVFVLTPLLSRPLIALAGPVLRLFGVSGKLARQNAVRNPRRTAATASALMIGLTLITGLTVIAGSVQKGIDKMAADSVKADYVVSMSSLTPLSPDVARTLKGQDEVTTVSSLQMSASRIDGDTEQLMGVDPDTIGEVTQLDFTEGSLSSLGGDKVVVDENTAEDHDWKVGSAVPVTFEDGEHGKLSIAALYDGNALVSGIMVDNATIAPHQEHSSVMQVMLKTKDGASDGTKDALKKALGDNPAVAVEDMDDISNDIAQIINLVLNMLYSLLGMAVVVAVIGVVNTLAMSVFERSQEIGMLRAIGLDRRGIKRMVRLESLVIALFGAVMGIALGVFFGWAAGELIKEGISTYELVLPWGRIGIFIALAAVVGMLAALWPARRAARLNMLSAIKAE